MAIDISQIFIFIANFFRLIFGFISNIILKISVDFSEVILLILSGIGGYFLVQSYERGKIKRWLFYTIVILIIYLLFRISGMGN